MCLVAFCKWKNNISEWKLLLKVLGFGIPIEGKVPSMMKNSVENKVGMAVSQKDVAD